MSKPSKYYTKRKRDILVLILHFFRLAGIPLLEKMNHFTTPPHLPIFVNENGEELNH